MNAPKRHIQAKERTGIVLMTYGSATTARNVREFFNSIYKGKASEATIKKFENRYRTIGHSPLIEITKRQAELLEKQLGKSYCVRAGMRYSAPSIEEAVESCKNAGATSLVGIILSPQYSKFIMNGYIETFKKAARTYKFPESHTKLAKPWYSEKHFIDYLSTQTKISLQKLTKKYKEVPIIFSTHSLPKRVVKDDPNYLFQLKRTINAVLHKLPSKHIWFQGYQSAGHTEEEWLKPDVKDILVDLHTKGVQAALIVPIQFLSDHLEILYDLDVAAKEQCEEIGIKYHRIQLPNTHKLFISALKTIALTTAKK